MLVRIPPERLNGTSRGKRLADLNSLILFINTDSMLQSAVHYKAGADGLCFTANDPIDDVTR